MHDNDQNGFGRRYGDAYAALPGTFDVANQKPETWRDLVSAGVTFGLGLAALAALVLVLSS